jgi:hypothetical protein
MSSLKLTLSMAVVLLLAVSVGTALAQEPVLISSDAFTGTAVIWDDQSLSDAITYTMSNVPAPSGGTEYVGWLISDDGSRKLSTGAMTVSDDDTVAHSFDSENARYTGEDLILGYSAVAITEEAVGADPDAPAGPVVFSHAVPPGAIAHIRHLLSDWPPGSGVGILTNVKLQLGVAYTHANLANDQTSIENVRRHLEHVINAIEGPGGANAGDLDGNGSIEDFGDGKGALLHIEDRKHSSFAAGQALSDAVIQTHSAGVETNGKSAEDWANQAVAEALIALVETDLSFAKFSVAGVIGFLRNALEGVDADASGVIDSVAGEGGAAQAYVEAQLMATYTLQVGPLPTPTPTPTATRAPTSTPTAVPPTPTPTPEAPSVGDTAVPGLANLAMLAAVLFLVGGGVVLLRRRRRA